MSERVTWEVCLRCGGRAAVGWSPVLAVGGSRSGYRAIEFDCRAGCQVDLEELASAYELPPYDPSS
jgi:hypothetical protein